MARVFDVVTKREMAPRLYCTECAYASSAVKHHFPTAKLGDIACHYGEKCPAPIAEEEGE